MNNKLNKENILDEMSRLYEAIPVDVLSKDLCIVLHPTQVEQYLNALGATNIEKLPLYFLGIKIYNIEDFMLYKNSKMVEDFENKMIITKDLGEEEFKRNFWFCSSITK